MLILKGSIGLSLGLMTVASIASATDVTGALTFVGITPCRIIETRGGYGFTGQAGPPSLVANANRTFQITGTVPGVPIQCGIPTAALAISVNFTATGFAGQGDIRVFPAGGTLPLTSILNYQLENIANATTVPLGPSGGGQNGITVRADASGTDFIADVNGYYVPRRAAAACFDNANRYVDCGNGTVTDTVTGLIWLKKANCLYGTYLDATQYAAQLAEGNTILLCGLTDGSLPGDWRLPTKAEWLATVARAVALACNPSLTNDPGTGCLIAGPTSFTGVGANAYWSSNANELAPDTAWAIGLGSGTSFAALKSSLQYIWPVRGGQ